MRDSTVFGEKIGHIKFSTLIQDCFSDLANSILKHSVEVNQYVSGEAVLTWKIREGLQNLNGLSVYYHFMDILNNRSDYYQSIFCNENLCTNDDALQQECQEFLISCLLAQSGKDYDECLISALAICRF